MFPVLFTLVPPVAYIPIEFKCFEEFAVVIDEYIDHYNNQRIQEKQNGYLL